MLNKLRKSLVKKIHNNKIKPNLPSPCARHVTPPPSLISSHFLSPESPKTPLILGFFILTTISLSLSLSLERQDTTSTTSIIIYVPHNASTPISSSPSPLPTIAQIQWSILKGKLYKLKGNGAFGR